MKKLSLVICLLLTVSYSYGQFSGDSIRLYNMLYKSVSQADVKPIIPSTDKFHFRFWDDDQVVDIWTPDGITFNGSIVDWTEESKRNNSERTPKFFSRKTAIDSLTAKKAYQLIQSVADIPSDKYIKGYSQGFDGEEFMFEIATPDTYSARTYWSPSLFKDSIAEASKIQTFIDSLNTLLSLGNEYSNFLKGVPAGSYSNGGGTVMLHFSQEYQQYKQQMQPYMKYFNSINDTLNHFLSTALTNIFQKKGDLVRMKESYFLYFSKDNQLLDVVPFYTKYDQEEIALDEKYEKKIKAAFSSIKLHFIHAPVGYTRVLKIQEDKVMIYFPNW